MYEYVDNLELTTQSVPSGMLLSEVVFAGTQREEQLLSCDSLRPIRTSENQPDSLPLAHICLP